MIDHAKITEAERSKAPQSVRHLKSMDDLLGSESWTGVKRKFGYTRAEIEQAFLLMTSKIKDSCWLWTGSKNKHGYGRLSFGKTFRYVQAHRVAYVLWNGDIPSGLMVLHSCDNPPCVNPLHLHLGTNIINMREAKSRFRFPHGSNHRRAKLTEADADKIRSDYAKGLVSHQDLAIKYHVVKSTIHCLLTRKTWRHL